MSLPIALLEISTSVQEEQRFRKDGFIKLSGNLNSGTQGSPEYLWYKRGWKAPMTRLQFSFKSEMDEGLSAAGFTCIKKNLNKGAGGDSIYLWYMSGNSDCDYFIMDLKLTLKVESEPALFEAGWERLGCDLNRGAGGDAIYLWVKRSEPTYLLDVKGAVYFSEDADLFQQGYVRVDEDTNKGAQAPASPVFLWYQSTRDSCDVINTLEVSQSDADEKKLQSEGFIKVHTRLNINTYAYAVYLWYKCGQTSGIQNFTVLVGDTARNAYKAANCKVVEKNLNYGAGGTPLYIAYVQ